MAWVKLPPGNDNDQWVLLIHVWLALQVAVEATCTDYHSLQ